LIVFLAFYLSLNAKEFIVGTAKEFHLALKSAENNQEDDSILLQNGRYISSYRYPFLYESKENYDISIIGNSDNREDVIIDGNGIGSALKIVNSHHELVIHIKNLTVRNGYTKQKGGGILIENSGELNIENVELSHNRADYDGGGLYSLGNILMKSCEISDNYSTRGIGGGIYTDKSAILTLVDISYNSSKKHGGAVFGGKTVIVSGSKFNFNRSNYGGAIYGEKKIKATKSLFLNNSAKYDGGALKGETVYIFESNVSTNSAGNYGGAIFGEKSVSVENINFYRNSAKYGGAIYSIEGNIKSSEFIRNFSRYSGGAIKTDRTVIKNSNLFQNKSNRAGGAVASTKVIVSNCDFKKNRSYKGGAVFSKRAIVTNSYFKENSSSNSGGAIKGFDIKIRYSTLCNNHSDRTGGAIDGVNVVITNSNLSKNRSYKGGAIYAFHTSKSNISNSFLFQNSATYGGAIFGNTKVFNSLLVDNYGKGMSLYGKGSVVNSVVKNTTAKDLVSQEIFMNGDIALENNYLTLSNIYNYQLYRLETRGNTPVLNIPNKKDLSSIFGKESKISSIGLEPNSKSNCKELFDTKDAYDYLLEMAQIDEEEIDDNETSEEIEKEVVVQLDRNRTKESAEVINIDITDLVIEGEQKIYSELFFVAITKENKEKEKIANHYIDFDEGKGFEEIRGNPITHRFHNPGIKNIKVKIVGTKGSNLEREFPIQIDDLSREEFNALMKDPETRAYLESISKGVLNVADNPRESSYHKAIDVKPNKRKRPEKEREFFAEIDEKKDEHNISKMIKFNKSVTEVREYILSNLEEFNLVSKDESIKAINNAKRYIIENPTEFNLTSFKNYEEVIIDIENRILRNIDDYNLTEKKNVNIAYSKGKNEVIDDPKKFNLISMNKVKDEMVKLTAKIKQDPAKYGIKITKEILDGLDKGWSLLGTLSEIQDVTMFDGFKIVWIFADGRFQGYSPIPSIRNKIRNSNFTVFKKVPKNAGLWLYK
jgi:predicted outer membrane repeat protein